MSPAEGRKGQQRAGRRSRTLREAPWEKQARGWGLCENLLGLAGDQHTQLCFSENKEATLSTCCNDKLNPVGGSDIPAVTRTRPGRFLSLHLCCFHACQVGGGASCAQQQILHGPRQGGGTWPDRPITAAAGEPGRAQRSDGTGRTPLLEAGLTSRPITTLRGESGVCEEMDVCRCVAPSSSTPAPLLQHPRTRFSRDRKQEAAEKKRRRRSRRRRKTFLQAPPTPTVPTNRKPGALTSWLHWWRRQSSWSDFSVTDRRSIQSAVQVSS